ncbi:MAG: thiamine phosphate synthase [archaeon]
MKKIETQPKIQRLYLITDRHLSRQGEEKDAEDALKAGIKIIQYREKDLPQEQILKTAEKLRALTREYGATLIINDHPEIAEKVHADGLHIGQGDTNIHEARKIFKGKIIGVSAKTLEESKKAEREGATYIGLGPIFDTATKNDAGQGIGLNKLKEIKKTINIPIVAIGGINRQNAKEVLESGADSIAVVSAIIGKDIKIETENLIKITGR